MNYYVYIIQSRSTNKFYTRITNDLKRRLKEHNKVKSNTNVSRNLTDFEYIYTEQFASRTEARKKEIYLKSGVGREFRSKLIESKKRV